MVEPSTCRFLVDTPKGKRLLGTLCIDGRLIIQGGSNMTGTNCDLFTHKSSRSYLNHLVYKNIAST
jgi:hypothetical protein